MKIAEIFNNSMVLQRDMPIKIFGSGKGSVTVEFDGETATAVSDGEKWCVELKSRSFGGPYEMNIDLNGEKIKFSDIMIGDVWLACGQSNMELPLYKTEGGIKESEQYKNDNIRFYTVPRRYAKGRTVWDWYYDAEGDEGYLWRKCEGEASAYFSSVGYYFSKEIQAATDVPIGVISCNWGGRRIETFVDREHSMECDALRPDLEDFEAHNATLDMDEYNKDYELFEKNIKEYYTLRDKISNYELVKKIGVRAAASHPESASCPLMPNRGPYDSYSPTNLWETMFDELVPLSVKGMLWYQGESNDQDTNYIDKYGAFLKCIRDNFGYNMPVYAIELAGFVCWWMPGGGIHEDNYVADKGFALIREQQQKATEIFDNNYLVTTMDYGDLYDIHPPQKEEVSKRLAKKALKYTYGFDIEADQPIYKSVRFEGSKAYITFEHGEGIYCECPDQIGMFIGGADKKLYPAKLEIVGDNLICLQSDEVRKPTFVRYAFGNYYLKKHIYNRVGLPLAPFRTDK